VLQGVVDVGAERAVTNLRWEWDPVKVTGSQGSTSTYTDHDHLRQTCVFPVRADLKAGPRLAREGGIDDVRSLEC